MTGGQARKAEKGGEGKGCCGPQAVSELSA